MVGVVAGGLAMFVLLFQMWVLAAFLAGLFVISIAASTVLLPRADPDELRRRQEGSQRLVEAWGRGMGSAAGGWKTHARRKRLAQGESARRDDSRSD
jgi:hypothetical protein